jgi:3-phenylpropionate/trans-cinnamate dioxygenase ferredoxin subunit
MDALSGWRRVAAASQLRDGEACPAKLGDTPIALYQLNGQVYAIDDVCTHEYALLSQGFVEDGAIECPLHQAKFDIASGVVQPRRRRSTLTATRSALKGTMCT